ncbi:MAG TPA: T9SS type A sorting domain-containing protein [Bacteroidota bacterium]|nr:T9SS type A sorting domain-containing protein [Bacteroidota bacterium]
MKRRYAIILCIVTTFLAATLSLVKRMETVDSGCRPEHEDRSGALAALNYWSSMRAYPERDVPASAYFHAYQLETAKRKDFDRTVSSSNIWTPIGPTNLHGRCLSVAVNPHNRYTIYLGTASGGLWRSYTGGLGGDWQQVRLGYPALGISDIVIDPADTNVIYIGTGEVYRYGSALGGLMVRTTRGSYGIGILKTTDGGIIWTKSLDWTYQQQSGVERLAMNPQNPSTVFAATTEGLYRTVDGGQNWTNVVPYLLMGEDIVINPSDTTKILASFGNFGINPFVMKSTDGGVNWFFSSFPSSTGKTMLCGSKSNPNIVYASSADSTIGNGGLFASADFGDSWVEVSNSSTNPIFQVQGFYSHYVIVHPTNPNIVIQNSVGSSKSTDGGVTFTTVTSNYADNHSYAYDPVDTNTVYVVNDDGIYRSTDFGSTYTDVGAGLQTGQLYNGFSCSSSDSLMAIGQSQDHIPGYRYLGSMVWDHNTVTDETGWTATDPTNDNIQYADGRNGEYIVKSTDRGASFSYVWGFSGVGGWNTPFALAPSNPTVLYFCDNKVYKSINSAVSWSVQNGGALLDSGNTALSMAVAPTSQDTAIVGMAPIYHRARLFRTTNGGTTWVDITGLTPDRYPIDLAIDPKDSKTMYATFGGFGSGHLYKTADAGGSWANITGSLPDVPTDAVAIDPFNSSYVYVGNDIGVYLSTNGGATWAPFSTGLPDAVIVADLVISPSNRSLRAVTHGNGVYERKLYNGTAIPTFDYHALALDYPSDGALLTQSPAISGIKASFQNAGIQAQTDSFNVKYRILRNTVEVFSSIKKTAGLGLGETRIVTFDNAFSPPDTGTYILQAISLAVDQDPTNDTVKGTMVVVAPSMVTKWTITKDHCPYAEISGGSPGPVGDDVQLRVPLPFAFRYDGIDYDSAQISTNGWMELGEGTEGALYGLSTDGQIGGFFNPVLSTTTRPTKVLGPWYADLATGSTGVISYTTQGTAPNRTFVVQWKNMPAYYDESGTTTKLNFQILLDESTSIVEFHYGPLVSGTFNGTGAAMGLKDAIGGDYRYFDLYRDSTGLAPQLREDLTPLANWPGQDSCFHIDTNPFNVTLSLLPLWNLVSEPVDLPNRWFKAIFPSAVGSAFEYVHRYQMVDSLVPGRGYWVKVPTSALETFTGDSLPEVSVAVDSGWNIIGSVDHNIPAPSGGIVASNVFAYNGSYQIVSTLSPGKGYWLKTNAAGTLNLGPQAVPRTVSQITEPPNSITITDQSGHKQKLYLVADGDRRFNPSLYALPPKPPAGGFDVRFASQQMMETFESSSSEPAEYPLEIQSAQYPLTVTYSIKTLEGMALTLDENASGEVKQHPLKGDGSLVVAGGDGNSLKLKITNGKSVPTAFALVQNYPNPFNPATTIRFDLPTKNHVNLTVYDVLGREVMNLVNGVLGAGSYTVPANLSTMASGVYIYRLTAGDFTDVKKMLLVK